MRGNGHPAAETWHEHGERRVQAARTVERLRASCSAFGITRLARQTGLDRIGIPCYAAIRPAASTLSTSQGKGLDDAAAQASALMEAIEFAVAEQAQPQARRASAAELSARGEAYFDPHRLLPADTPLPADRPIRWLQGRSWPGGAPIWVPLDAVSLGGEAEDLPAIGRSSNGLASGNCTEEALFHAICELIERDATSLWSLRTDPARLATEFAVEAVADATVRQLGERIAAAGLELRLFDQTTDLGVPSVMALIVETGGGAARAFDLAAGYGAHPVGSRAMVRAITEAAQTRITNIAGGRDDFLPDEYEMQADETVRFLEERHAADASAPDWLPAGTPLPELLDELADRLGEAADIAWVALGDGAHGISVLRAISGRLEERETNVNWRPGERALRALQQ